MERVGGVAVADSVKYLGLDIDFGPALLPYYVISIRYITITTLLAISLIGVQIRSILFTDSSNWRSCNYKLLGYIISIWYHVLYVYHRPVLLFLLMW